MATKKPTTRKTKSAKSGTTSRKSTKKATGSKKVTAKSASSAKKVLETISKSRSTSRKTTKTPVDVSLKLADEVVLAILEKKGENIVCLDLRSIENAVSSFYIICEGNSDTQVEAIADAVEGLVKKNLGQRPYRSEGWENALWILIDYIDVVVHVFERETRMFYNLERLWADATEIRYTAKGIRVNSSR
jgi:ribosome-associated protein